MNPPKPIDLSNARTASLALNLDLDLSDDEAVTERQLANGGGRNRRTLVGGAGRRGYEPIFQDEDEEEAVGGGSRSGSGRQSREGVRKPLDVGGERGREGLSREDEDT